MTETKNFERNTATAAQVSNPEFARDLRLVQAELDDVTDALLNLAGRLHELAGFIADHSNRQSAVTKQEANL